MSIENLFNNIADAVRLKGGTVGSIKGADLPNAVNNIDTGPLELLLTRKIDKYYDNDAVYISDNSLQGCFYLTSISFPKVTTIGARAFQECISLTSISFLNATSISTNAFAYCSALTSVSFPNATFIGDAAFAYCTSLTSVSFPVATSIGVETFYSCTSLTSISFPAVSYIGASAFQSCTSLTTLVLAGSSVATLVNYNAFNTTPMSGSTYTGSFGSIYVPSSLVASYKAASNWSRYSARITAIT